MIVTPGIFLRILRCFTPGFPRFANMQYTQKELKNALQVILRSMGGSTGDPTGMGVVIDAAPRDSMDFRTEEREVHNLVSSPFRLDLLKHLILAHN